MKRILITDMSGSGKSTLIGELRALGYKGVRMDEPGWSESTPDGDWVWREDCVRDLLSQEGTLFLSGCATNQGEFNPQFDEIFYEGTLRETCFRPVENSEGRAVYGERVRGEGPRSRSMWMAGSPEEEWMENLRYRRAYGIAHGLAFEARTSSDPDAWQVDPTDRILAEVIRQMTPVNDDLDSATLGLIREAVGDAVAKRRPRW